MKKILITGENGFIGKSFGDWILSNKKKYDITYISLKNNEWKNYSFSKYDVLIHLAAIVHKKEKKISYELYESINVNLTEQLALKCIEDSVKHFVFFSTMSVYGQEGSLIETVKLDENSNLSPTSMYGKSKLIAEKKILKILENKNSTEVSIIRPPMVYGENCPGNYEKLQSVANFLFVVPTLNNSRSVIHIDNLSSYLFEIIENNRYGLHLPQDKNFMNTINEILKVRKLNNKKTIESELLGIFIKKYLSNNRLIKKVFGNLIYSNTNKEVKL